MEKQPGDEARQSAVIRVEELKVVLVPQGFRCASENVVEQVAHGRRVSHDLPIEEARFNWDSVLEEEQRILLKLHRTLQTRRDANSAR